METFFKDKSGKVLVVDSSGAARTLLAEVVRSIGFADVNGCAGVKEAIEMMEVEAVDWVIAPLQMDNPENAFKLLELVYTEPMLKHVRVSFLLEESEQEIVPDGVAHGLLSHHMKPFTKDSLTQDINNLLTTMEGYDWSAPLTAGHYLRNVLTLSGRLEELLTFERKLLDMYPGRIDQMYNVVPPMVDLGFKSEGMSILRQIKLIDPGEEEKIKSILDDLFEGASLDSEEGGETPNLLGLNKVLLVDGDSAVATEVQEIFGELGVPEVIVCDEGEAGIAALEANEDIDLVIQEWRIDKLTGPLFLQKAQEVAKSTFPFVLLSSLIEEQDQPFVREMGVAAIIPKPLNREEFIKTLIWTMQQDRMPTEQTSMERKMRQFLDERNIPEAQAIKDRYVADSSIKIGPKVLIEAEFSHANKEYEKARDFGIEAIKHSGDSIFTLNLLGKIMMNLREFNIALKCFEKAQQLAPMNLERLCQIAEVHSEMGDQEKAQESVEAAQDLDPDSEKVQETSAKVAINSGNTEGAKKILEQLKAIENVVSYMNNQAVALARCDMFAEGIEQYKTTLSSIPETRKDIYAIVSYNLSLAYLRAANAEEAVKSLEVAVSHESIVKEKSQKLLDRVKSAIKKGRPVQVQKADVPVANPEDVAKGDESDVVMDGAKNKVLSVVQNNPGDIACYLIFQSAKQLETVDKMLSGTIRFSPRDSIVRGEAAVNEAS